MFSFEMSETGPLNTKKES